jgi:DNA-binding NarL/FixJ family response regulator
MHVKSKIMIVEDHPIFRKGLSHLINEEKDMAVVCEAEDVLSAKKCLEKQRPDLVIVDLSLKDGSGLELIKHIHEFHKNTAILVLSMHDEMIYARRALHAGAGGYIMKQEMTGKVIMAIHQVLKGKKFVSDAVVETLLDTLTGKSPASFYNPIDSLSDREIQVFRLIGKGMGRSDMAKILNVSVKTIGSYREKIKEKMGIKAAPELIKQAVEWVKNEDH